MKGPALPRRRGLWRRGPAGYRRVLEKQGFDAAALATLEVEFDEAFYLQANPDIREGGHAAA